MKVAVVHPGTQHSRQTALALQQLGRLAFLATGMFSAAGDRVDWLADRTPGRIGERLRREWERFAFASLDPANVRTFPRYELPERIARRLGMERLAATLDILGNQAFGPRIARIVDGQGPVALWGYDGSAYASFADPRCAHVPRILDRTIADGRHWNAELALIRETHGDWLLPGERGWSGAQIARDEVEYAAADHILCGSPFAADTVRRYAHAAGTAEKLRVLPYPFDAALFGGTPPPLYVPKGKPVRFLFVGQVTARKGIHHLLEAIGHLDLMEARLTVAGPVGVPRKMLARYADRVSFRGPVARGEVPSLMQRHHVLVLPSHFEGSAIVLPEAMASGLALVHTAASGLGASTASGIVLDRPDAEAVARAMAALCADRENLHAMRQAAQVESVIRSFAAYRGGIEHFLSEAEI